MNFWIDNYDFLDSEFDYVNKDDSKLGSDGFNSDIKVINDENNVNKGKLGWWIRRRRKTKNKSCCK